MFALLLSDEMTPFVSNITSFPTVFFTLILGIVLLYWCVAVLGLVDIDVLDFDGPDLDGADGEVGSPNVLAGLLIRLGLTGVPVTIILSFIALFGWLISYYAMHLVGSLAGSLLDDGVLRYLIGLPVLVATLLIAALLTAIVIRPIRPFFKSAQQETVKYLLGQTAIVRTLRVDSGFGEAVLEDGGAGLILKVRARGEQTFVKGDRVVLLEHVPEAGVYQVVSEEEFARPV